MRTDKIIEIVELDERETIDIEVSGNHLFLANGILTHNSNSDVGLEDTSESFGLPATADFMFALISTEELESLGQLMVKQLKNDGAIQITSNGSSLALIDLRCDCLTPSYRRKRISWTIRP
jgi:hypothetical protein